MKWKFFQSRYFRVSLWFVFLMANALPGAPAISTEAFLNTLGVNVHLKGLTPSDPWNTNLPQIAQQLNYIGVRLVREWVNKPDYGPILNNLKTLWRPDGRFWTSISMDGPAWQRSNISALKQITSNYSGLFYVLGGPNEEDGPYAQSLGATLPDSALVQADLFSWASPLGFKVNQMDFGAGWTASNNWQGDYNPTNTGIKQNYTPGPAHFGSAHTYLSVTNELPKKKLDMLRKLALLTSPGKPVAHTEVGAYFSTGLSPAVYGQYMVMGALDAIAAGDVGYLVYGLQDSDGTQTYGFFSHPGGMTNPAAVYFHSLTTLLKSSSGSYGPGASPTFQPLSLGLSHTNTNVSHVVMQKPTGEFVVGLWSEQWMNASARHMTDRLDLGAFFTDIKVYHIQSGTNAMASYQNRRYVPLTLAPSDTYLVVVR